MKNHKERKRRCISCRESFPQNMLQRISLYKNELLIDDGYAAPGRGAYICKNEECIDLAKRKNLLQRSYKCKFEKEQTDAVYDSLLKKYGRQ